MPLTELTRPDLIFPDLPGSDARAILRALADRIHATGSVPDADDLYDRLFEREQLGSTALGAGVAVPHCKLGSVERVVLAVGMTRQEVDFAAADGEPVRLFFLIVSPEDDPAAHLRALAAVSKWVKTHQKAGTLVDLDDRLEIYALLQTEYA